MTADFPTQYQHQEHEERLYAKWEQQNLFAPDGNPHVDSTQPPYSILMPPPNANASLHAGHAMYVIQDIMTRYHRMLGHPTVWFPGTDHAGFETQFVYEKQLKKEGQSRFQFDRTTLYQQIAAFVQQNSGLIQAQMKRLGFSAHWAQSTFTLDQKVVETVVQTFTKLAEDGLIYRDNYLVNYCPKCGTTFADLEVTHEQRTTPLYYIRYRFSDGEPRVIDVNGQKQEMSYLTVATVRPETIFADVALAINPNDPRVAMLQGEYVLNPLTRQPIPVISDDYVDPEFGTGILKITPAHDPNDFQIGRAHNLPQPSTINTMGKIDLSWLNPEQEPAYTRAQQLKEQFQGLSVFHARPAVAKLLEAENALDHIDDKYQHNVTVCYKGQHEIEPLLYPNWFVKMAPLAELGQEAISTGETRLIPARFTKQYTQWLGNIRDWPISRQIVWGIQIPVWYNARQNQDIFVSYLDQNGERHNQTVAAALAAGHTLAQIKAGLQTLTAPINTPYEIGARPPARHTDDYLPETDTFDTWFSSGQWPLVVLGYPDHANFQQYYPTNLLDTMWDILFFWVARMIMLGKYLTKDSQHPTGRSPFKTVYLHSMVTDSKGAKMSKSKGNVINPLDIVNQFGADALRMALVAGSAPGNPISLSEAKVKGYRNFANKIWNIGRFLALQQSEFESLERLSISQLLTLDLNPSDQEILQKLQQLVSRTTDNLQNLRLSETALELYDFIWNDLASDYLENNKNRPDKERYWQVVWAVLSTSLKLLHPYMPFVTEAVWEKLRAPTDDEFIAIAPWPQVKS